MKIYRVTYDDAPDWGLLAISLVDFPAVEKNFVKFKDEHRPAVRFKADEEQHVVSGVALLADTPIYRRDEEHGEFYIVFEKEVIRQLVEKYSRDGKLNIINLQHDSDTYSAEQCVMVESYFIDKSRGIVPTEFADVPDGSWIVSFKVEDDALWDAIKASHGEEGGLNGFSVEVVMDMERKLKSDDAPIADCDALAAALGIKKKTDFRISRAEVNDLLKEDKQVDLKIGDEGDVLRGQVKDLGRRNGADVLSLFVPEQGKWYVLDLDDISGFKVTDIPVVDFDFDAPGYEDIVADDEIVVTDSREASDENLKAAIEGQFFVNLFYDDESGEPCTGSRVVQVCAAGYHTGTGNKCFRAYEWSGATHTEVPAWKMFLTKRVRSFRLMTEADRWTSVPPQYHMDDSQMEMIIAQVNDLVVS